MTDTDQETIDKDRKTLESAHRLNQPMVQKASKIFNPTKTPGFYNQSELSMSPSKTISPKSQL